MRELIVTDNRLFFDTIFRRSRFLYCSNTTSCVAFDSRLPYIALEKFSRINVSLLLIVPGSSANNFIDKNTKNIVATKTFLIYLS